MINRSINEFLKDKEKQNNDKMTLAINKHNYKKIESLSQEKRLIHELKNDLIGA